MGLKGLTGPVKVLTILKSIMYRNESENQGEKKVKQIQKTQNPGEMQINLIQTEQKQR